MVTPDLGKSNLTPVSQSDASEVADINKPVTLDRTGLVTQYKPKLVMSCNARPVTPLATEYKAYLLDTVRSIPLYGNSFKQLASKMNYFKQLMISSYRPISLGISGPASMSFAHVQK